jgi:hypothetical protein
MFELFEKREKQRKVKELREVCPDITDDEAAVALDMCNGREDEAAASLVSDPSFKRRVRAACGTGPPVAPTRRNNGNAGGAGSTNWPGRPNGPRPKLIDPATLGDSVFVGSFRGKGFQGIVKGPVAKLPPQQRNGASGSGGSRQKGPSTAEETSEDAEKEEASENPEEPTAVENEQQEGVIAAEEEQVVEEMAVEEKDAVAGKNGSSSTPPAIPKNYALVLENSQGNVRPVTDSELKRAATAVKPEDASLAAAAIAEEEEEEEEEEAPLPLRASARRTSGVNVSMIEKMTIKLSAMDNEAGAAWMAKMAPEMSGKILQMLGDADPIRAITLQESLERAQSAASKELEQEQKAAAPVSTRKSPRNVPKKTIDDEDIEDAEWESEATISEGGKTSSRPRRAAASKKKAAAAAAAFFDEEELDDDEDFVVAGNNKKMSRQNSASKRRKSSPSNEEAATAAAAADTAVAMETDQKVAVIEPEKSAAAAAAPSSAPAPGVASRRASATTNNNSNQAAISSRGHTNRGRVKQKSHKNADLVEVGTLQTKNGWHNAGYIFPEGFQSRTLFRSSVAIDQLCVHECFIVGKGGEYWPAPTFKVVALDRPEEPLIAKSCTGCWTGILKRINAEIEARRKAGEDLPPPPKTAIAGPEYFGMNQPNITQEIEALDPKHECVQYWSGKEERMRAAAGLPSATTSGSGGGGGAPRAPRAPRASGALRRTGTGGGRGRHRNGSDSDGEHGEEGDEAQYTTNKWSSVSRTDRYRKRLEDNGEDTTNIDADNPVPEIIDPITLEPVIRPAISPYGHVMGAATWRAVLAENSTCPFTKQPLRFEQCKILTVHNIEFFRDKIIR